MGEVCPAAVLPAALANSTDSCDELITPKEAARLLTVPLSWVYAHADELPGYLRLGRYIRFRRALFLNFVREGGCE